jgi:hypothetical protein
VWSNSLSQLAILAGVRRAAPIDLQNQPGCLLDMTATVSAGIDQRHQHGRHAGVARALLPRFMSR